MKILIYGQPKSGTTALTYKIANALGSSTQVIFEPKSRNREIETGENIVTKCLFGFPPNHVSPDEIKEYNDYEKKIWIARDPRDIFISQFLYRWYHRSKSDERVFKGVLEKVKLKEKNRNSIPFYSLHVHRIDGEVLTLDRLRLHHQIMGEVLCDFIRGLDSDWFVFKYEDMIDGDFVKLNEYLGFEVKDNAEVPKTYLRVKRSKSYGNWRMWFTKEDVEFYRDLYTGYMQLIGYDTNDWEILDNETLPPELGSEYMKKLFFGGKNAEDNSLIGYIAKLSKRILNAWR